MPSRTLTVALVLVVVAVFCSLVGPGLVRQLALAQASITISIVPSQVSYAPNQQVTVRGTLSCSGQCPMVLLPDMEVHLSSSWGWSTTVQTDASGVYRCSTALPVLGGTYTVTAQFTGYGKTVQATRQVVVELGAIPEFPFPALMPFLVLAIVATFLRRRFICRNSNS